MEGYRSFGGEVYPEELGLEWAHTVLGHFRHSVSWPSVTGTVIFPHTLLRAHRAKQLWLRSS